MLRVANIIISIPHYILHRHCAGGSYEVVINRHDLDQSGSGQVIKMKREIKSPKYNAYTTDSDFNLVLLEEPVDMTGLRLVTLNSDKNYPPVGQRVTVMVRFILC